MCGSESSLCLCLVSPPLSDLCSCVLPCACVCETPSLQIVKIGPNPRLALHQLVSRARLPRFGVSSPRDSSLFLLCSYPIRKSPQKIAIPKICSLVGFCVVLLVLIHGSDAILVDLPPFAFLRPNFSFPPTIWSPKLSFSAQNRVSGSNRDSSRPAFRTSENFRTSDISFAEGCFQRRTSDLFRTSEIQLFRTSEV